MRLLLEKLLDILEAVLRFRRFLSIFPCIFANSTRFLNIILSLNSYSSVFFSLMPLISFRL